MPMPLNNFIQRTNIIIIKRFTPIFLAFLLLFKQTNRYLRFFSLSSLPINREYTVGFLHKAYMCLSIYQDIKLLY